MLKSVTIFLHHRHHPTLCRGPPAAGDACPSRYLRVLTTSCITLPRLSIMRSTSESAVAVTTEKPGSPLHNTVPAVALNTVIPQAE